MNLFLCTNSDGSNTEGIGAMVQYQLFTYALSRILKINYFFEPFKKMQHYQYFNISQEHFCLDINNFFNFPNELENKEEARIIDVTLNDNLQKLIDKFSFSNEKIIFNIKDNNFMKAVDSKIKIIEKFDILNDISEKINLKKDLKYFHNNEFNISIHIRKKTMTDCCNSPMREYFKDDSKNKIINVLEQTIQKFDQKGKKTVINVYSQGNENDFNFIKNKFKTNVKLHIEEYPIVSLYHMIHSDVLIMANSSFSYIAHLLSKNITLVRNNFYHSTYDRNKYFYDQKGNIL
jgi:hypothetical protein